jgi:hypothetical protein
LFYVGKGDNIPVIRATIGNPDKEAPTILKGYFRATLFVTTDNIERALERIGKARYW